MSSFFRHLLAASAFAFGLITAANAAGPAVIRIGTPDQSVGGTPSGGIALTTLLDVRKALETEFEKDGIRIEWTFFKGAGPAVNEALANKQLDFVYLGDLAAIIGRAGGLETRLLVPTRGANAFLVATPDSGIEKLEDLKGKRLTVFKGTAYQLSLDRALARVGLAERDLQVVNLDWNAALAALSAKQLDADWAGVSVLTLREKGLARLVTSTKVLGRDSTFQAGFLGTQAFISAQPEITQRFVDVIVRHQHWISQAENLGEFFTVTAARSGVPLSLGQAEYEGDDLKFRFSPRIDEFVIEGLTASVAQAKELGLIRRSIDVKAWVEPRFADRAVETLGLAGFWPLYDRQGAPVAP
ncbi:MAG: ABC transporter substrate-binding protein [Alphaproteobacteria bacterium]|jgi:sulfonate transport system substrate-binding protein|nr:ABC transporter substrate-binding protein [Alphaproteobacteria bacterium]